MSTDAALGGHFATDTAVRRTDEGTYAARIVPGWDIVGNANGGYLLAILARAMRDASGKPDVVTASAHYLSPGRGGDVTIDTETLKSGRTFTTVTGAMRSGETLLLPMDTLALLMAIDAFPPTAFNAALPVAWTPTVELTAHMRARPAPGWLRCEFTTRFVTGGFLEEDGTIWDDSGQLVAQSRQLALVPRVG